MVGVYPTDKASSRIFENNVIEIIEELKFVCDVKFS